MSTIAFHVIELVKSLPEEDRHTITEALNRDFSQPVLHGEPLSDADITESSRVNIAALDAARSLHGRFAGGKMLDSLLRERASDRERENEQLRRR